MDPSLLLFIVPLTAVYIVASRCPVGMSAGARLSFRPPPVVFTVVWPLLLLLMGVSWRKCMQASGDSRLMICHCIYASTVLALMAWIGLYACDAAKEQAPWALVIAICGVLLASQQGSSTSRSLVAPLLAWLIFALVMNCDELVSEKSKGT